ncbi:MAG: alpha/beta hydrolase [Candidatus Omnitrophota bacterium]
MILVNRQHICKVMVLMITCSLLAGCTSMTAQKSQLYLSDLYRRIAYRQEGDYRVIDIFYSTNREVIEKADTPLRFKPKMIDELTSGVLEIKLDPSIKIGKMLPSRFKRKGEIGIQNIQKMDNDLFIQNLTKVVKESPHKSLLVLVFGFKDDFETTAIKAAYFAYLLDVNTPILLFGWPGDQPVTIGGYKRAQKYAEESGPYLGELLRDIIRKVKPERVWIEASSLGCQVVCNAFEHMYKYDDLADRETEIEDVFLAAPDVGENEFDEKFRHEIVALSDNLTTYVSSNDSALLISAIINQEKRVGRQDIKAFKEHKQLEEAKDILYLKSLEPDKIALIDVTPINKATYGHGYYLEDPLFFDDVYLRIFGNQPQANRRLYLLKYKGDVDYWILRSD